MTREQEIKIVNWYRSQYRSRTRAVKNGTANINWLSTSYRVTTTEVRAYAESIGVNLSVTDIANIMVKLGNKRDRND